MIIHSLNRQVLELVEHTPYNVVDHAPSTYEELKSHLGTLPVWSGASDRTIFGDPRVNHAFRAHHDTLHLRYQLPFTLEGELELARLQARCYFGDVVQDAIYLEVAAQALHLAETGEFVVNQSDFTLKKLDELNHRYRRKL